MMPDYAFLLHELHHLKPDGVMTIVLPHGVLFRGAPDDGAEGQIRKRLIEKNQIDAIIGLPANIFFGTGIPTLVMVLKQHRQNDDILIIDASKGFVKEGKQNKLRASDIKRIADTWRDRADVPGFSRKVSREEVRANNYNLNIPRYVDSSEAPEQYDIYATMFGGIPNSEIDKLQKYWEVFPLLKKRLFAPIPGKAYSQRKDEDVLGAFMLSEDAHVFKNQVYDAVEGLPEKMEDVLVEHVMTVKEMQAHDELAAEIFHRFEDIPLVDCYRIYQLLSNQWQMIVNDIETIQAEGLDAVRTVEPAMKLVKDGDDEKEVPDGMKGRILPFELVQEDNDCLEKYVDAVKAKENRQESITSEIDELIESFTEDETQEYMEGEDSPKPDKTKIKKDAKAKGDDIELETKKKLKTLADLWDEQTKLNKALKEARQTLTDKTIEYIEGLSDERAKEWIHCKWIMPVIDGILNTPDEICEELEKAVDAMSQKYATSYHDLNKQLTEAQDELSGLISQLEGDETSIEGLNALMNSFKD